jgi:hypothetical protein
MRAWRSSGAALGTARQHFGAAVGAAVSPWHSSFGAAQHNLLSPQGKVVQSFAISPVKTVAK